MLHNNKVIIREWWWPWQVLTTAIIPVSVPKFSLYESTKGKREQVHFRSIVLRCGFCLEKTRYVAALCLNSSTSRFSCHTPTSVSECSSNKHIFFLELLGCRSHAGHEWLHCLESRVPSSLARSEKQKQRTKKNKKKLSQTRPQFDPRDADRGGKHQFR